MADWTPEEGFLKKLLIWGTFEDREVHGMVECPLAGRSIAPVTTDPHAVQESSGLTNSTWSTDGSLCALVPGLSSPLSD